MTSCDMNLKIRDMVFCYVLVTLRNTRVTGIQYT